MNSIEIRRLAAKETGSKTRIWKIPRQPGDRPLPKVAWSLTIMDVAAQYQDAASYRDLVVQWGRRTMAEMGLLTIS